MLPNAMFSSASHEQKVRNSLLYPEPVRQKILLPVLKLELKLVPPVQQTLQETAEKSEQKGLHSQTLLELTQAEKSEQKEPHSQALLALKAWQTGS